MVLRFSGQAAFRSLVGPTASTPSRFSTPQIIFLARPFAAPSHILQSATRSYASSSSSSPPSSSSSSKQLVPADSKSSSEEYESLYSSRFKGQGAKRKRWYRSPLLMLLGFMPIFTFSLGWWQIQRLDWKLGLIEELEYKLKKQPIRLPKNINLDVLPTFEFRLVSVAGYLDHSRAMFLGPRVRDGEIGYNLVVPMKRDGGGGEVLVDRGFVSEKSMIIDESNPDNRRLRDDEAIKPSGHVTVTALLPRTQPPNMFTPENQPERNRWYHADPLAMAQYASTGSTKPLKLGPAEQVTNDQDDEYTPSAGVQDSVKQMLGLKGSKEEHHVLPVFLEEVFEGYDGNIRVEKGIPVGRAATIELRNQHLVYAATWFTLSAVTAAMFLMVARSKRPRAFT